MQWWNIETHRLANHQNTLQFEVLGFKGWKRSHRSNRNHAYHISQFGKYRGTYPYQTMCELHLCYCIHSCWFHVLGCTLSKASSSLLKTVMLHTTKPHLLEPCPVGFFGQRVVPKSQTVGNLNPCHLVPGCLERQWAFQMALEARSLDLLGRVGI